LAKFVSLNQRDWDKWVALYLLAYRSSRHEATGYSPAELYFWKDLRLPLDLIRGVLPGNERVNSFGSFVQELRHKLEGIHENVRQSLNVHSLRAKARYDEKARQLHFKEGQEVWFFNPRRIKGRTPKLQKDWEGPYRVITKLSDVVFRIPKSNKHRYKVVHADRLAPYFRRKIFN